MMRLYRGIVVLIAIVMLVSWGMAAEGKSDLKGKFSTGVTGYKPLDQYLGQKPVVTPTLTPVVGSTPSGPGTVTTVYYTLGALSRVPNTNAIMDTRIRLDTPNGSLYATKAVAVNPTFGIQQISQGTWVTRDGKLIIPYMQIPQVLPGNRFDFVEGIPLQYAIFDPYTSVHSPWLSNDSSQVPKSASPFATPGVSPIVMIPGSEGYWSVRLW